MYKKRKFLKRKNLKLQVKVVQENMNNLDINQKKNF